MTEDKWTARLPDGREVHYKRRKLASGKFEINARVLGTSKDFSKVLDYPVKRVDVETVFLSELM